MLLGSNVRLVELYSNFRQTNWQYRTYCHSMRFPKFRAEMGYVRENRYMGLLNGR